jgi:hypothetical protein
VISLLLKFILYTSRDIDPTGSESLQLVMGKERNIDIMARVVLPNPSVHLFAIPGPW